MRTLVRPRRACAPAWFRVCVVVACTWLNASEPLAASDAWRRVYIEDPSTRAAVEFALTGAARWLDNERCRGVLSEFRDEKERSLADRLGAHGVDPRSYLTLLLFRDGAEAAACADDMTFAVTIRSGRVVFVCGRKFERVWRSNARLAQALVIHEMLHTLGLGENPPPSTAITYRILTLCDSKQKREAGGPDASSSASPSTAVGSPPVFARPRAPGRRTTRERHRRSAPPAGQVLRRSRHRSRASCPRALTRPRQ